jgi:hypothetical protein
MEAVISVAFGLWIAITAFVYRAVTADKTKGGHKK